MCFINTFSFQQVFFTEKFYDLTGALTHLSLMGASVVTSPVLINVAGGTQLASSVFRPLLATLCVLVWASRLGLFLFSRISRDGKDVRFDEIKPNTLRFFNAWQIQVRP
jgi:steroid 5-alpha reductase family enzyme